MSVVDGWGGDDDLDAISTSEDDNFDFDGTQKDGSEANEGIVEEEEENAWADDDDLDFDDDSAFGIDNGDDIGRAVEPLVVNEKNTGFASSAMMDNIMTYIHDLADSALLHTTNHILESNLNNGDAALDLCRYYHDRPQLRDYTLNTEIPRMDYQIIISDEVVLTDTHDIQKHFLDYPVDDLVDDMLLRSSNQSLLADVFPILTDPAGMIRNQFLATAVATTCRFVIDMRRSNQPQRHLQADCQLNLSIPSGENGPSFQSKLNLCSLRLLIHFCPEPAYPSIKYEVVSIRPLLNPSIPIDVEKIRVAAVALEDQSLTDNALSINVSLNNVNARDNFIQSIISTQSGLKSALKDIDDVVNVSSKLTMLKSVTSALPSLPSANDIIEASGVTEVVQPNSKNDPFTNELEEEQYHHGRREHLITEATSISRPKPIVGGLLLSGIERLAKAATIPDQPPKLYKREEEHLPDLGTDQKGQKEDFSINRRDDFIPTRTLPPPPPPPTKPVSPKIAESPLVKELNQESNEEEPQKNCLLIDSNDDASFKGQIGQSKDEEDGWSDDDILEDESQENIDSGEEVPMKERTDTCEKSLTSKDSTSDPLFQVLREVSNFPVDSSTFVPNDFNYTSGRTIPTRKRFISSSERLGEMIQNIS